jgi:hypothetical protein
MSSIRFRPPAARSGTVKGEAFHKGDFLMTKLGKSSKKMDRK